MKIRHLLEIRSNKIDGIIELSSDDYSIEVTVEYEYEVSPSEHERGSQTYAGNVELLDWKAKPFKFNDKQYSKLEPELAKYIEYGQSFGKKNKIPDFDNKQVSNQDLTKIIDEYVTYMFYEHVVENIDVPQKRY